MKYNRMNQQQLKMRYSFFLSACALVHVASFAQTMGKGHSGDGQSAYGFNDGRIPLGTSYPDVVEHVTTLLRDPRLQGCTVVVDATGVGWPVVELLRKAQMNCRLLPL